MATCIHCATPFSASDQLEKFCCRGCEYVYDLIHDEGLDRFYELRSNSSIRPVRSTPFETQDLDWLAQLIAKTEENHEAAEPVEADFSLEGLSCVGCVWLVESVFLRHPGALEASAHPSTGLLRLRWSARETDLAAFATEIAAFGYTLTSRKSGTARSEARQLGAQLGLCAAFAMNAMVFTLPTYVGMPEDFAFAGIFKLVTFLSATLSMLIGGSYFIKRAWHAVLSRTPHIDLPIALGILLAFGGSLVGWTFDLKGLMYFDFVATFIFLMLGGRYLQLAAVEKNRNRLQRRRPLPDHFSSPDRAEPILISELCPGIRFELQPGQSVPVAATLDSSAADFSLEWINGEAESQTFQTGRTLPAGAIYLGKDSVTLTAGESWENSLLARLTGSDRIATRIPALEKILRIYLIVIIIVGCVGFAVWLATAGAAEALQVMLSIFVVSCPCALGVALPLADELAGTRMERAGVFIREAQIWPRLCAIKTIIFDKTGTLTLERPILTNAEVLMTLTDPGRLALARLTHGSLHPVSRSLLEALGKKGQELLRSTPVAEIEDVPGMGRFFENETGRWTLGRPGWASNAPHSHAPHDAELSHDGAAVALFHFRETLRPDSAQALQKLKTNGHRLIILSGDKKDKVAAVAASLGIKENDAHASLLPEQKEEIVRKLDHQDTLYLGDGANDSLAFNAAYVTGTPVVDRSLLESKSDFFFLGQSLRFLPGMLALAHHRKRTVKIAFSFALIYNAAAITTALLGHMNPLLAAIIMPLSSAISLTIVARGLKART